MSVAVYYASLAPQARGVSKAKGFGKMCEKPRRFSGIRPGLSSCTCRLGKAATTVLMFISINRASQLFDLKLGSASSGA